MNAFTVPVPRHAKRGVIVVVVAALFAVTVLSTEVASTQEPAMPTLGETAGFSPGGPFLWSSDSDLARDLDAMAASGARWLRVDFDWPSTQPTKTSFNWSNLDRIVRGAHQRGLRILALPAYTPSWARPAGTTDKHPPTDPSHFADFVRAAAERYAPQGVRHWEIWNEPNIVPFWQPRPDPVAYTRLLVAASTAIKSVDPAATVLTGGFAPSLDDDGNIAPLTFLRSIYDNGGRASFDAVGHHPYHYPYAIDAVGAWNAWSAVTPTLRDLMVDRGDSHKRIWLTEYGAPTGTSDQSVSEDAQARLIRDAFRAVEAWPWAGPLFWYAHRDQGTDPDDREDNFGLVRSNYAPKPAFAVFRSLMATAAPRTAAPISSDTASSDPGGLVRPTTPDASQSEPAVPTGIEASVERVGGVDRYDTAARLSAARYPDGAEVVYLATGSDYADALTAAPATRGDGPVLLVAPDQIPAATAAELDRLQPHRIVLVGGPRAISDEVARRAAAHTRGTISRVARIDRYATAAELAGALESGVETVYVATGTDFADALSGGAAATGDDTAILLVTPNSIPQTTAAQLERLRPRRIIVLGGPAAISDQVVTELGRFAGHVARYGGADRYATSSAQSAATFAAPAETVYLTTGDGFADGVTAGATTDPVLLTRRECIPAAVLAELERLRPEKLVLVGGSTAVSDAVGDLVRC